MFGFLKRLLRLAQANSHAAIDKLEDPIKMTEQGIRDLKRDLESSLQGLAEAKSFLIRIQKEAEEKRQLALSYENKAVLLLKKAESGALDAEQADRLAAASLEKQQLTEQDATRLREGVARQVAQNQKLEARVAELKSQIQRWENEVRTLRARAKVAAASKKLNKQLAQIDSNATLALLEKMKERVAEDEAMADSYAELGPSPHASALDLEIDRALAGSAAQPSLPEPTQAAQDSLAALKARLRKP